MAESRRRKLWDFFKKKQAENPEGFEETWIGDQTPPPDDPPPPPKKKKFWQ